MIYQVLLEQEAVRGERTAWIFRWVLYGLVMTLASVVYFVQGHEAGLYGMLLCAVLLLYNVALTGVIRREQGNAWIRYLSVTLDVLGLTLYNAVDTVFTSTLVPATTAALLLYPVILLLASLRLDRGLIVYATVFSVVAMNALFIWAYPYFDQTLAARVVSADIPGQVYRTAYVTLCGFLMLFVPGTVTRLLRNQQNLYHKSQANLELAHQDKLTGLANRRRLDDYLPGELARTKADGLKLGIIYLDLDGFKPINDELGHDVGDQVLKEVAQRLTALVRDSDLAVRMGGDEFVVVVSRVDSPERCQLLADRIKQSVCQDVQVGTHRVAVGASFGLAIFPDDGIEPEQLFAHADKAMLSRKSRRR